MSAQKGKQNDRKILKTHDAGIYKDAIYGIKIIMKTKVGPHFINVDWKGKSKEMF
ncbi:MAG: hypothetical protein IPJ13_15585 [Saprospiraceae bacterium]|nr:hypothetical protein [Saprospiraceae bacterium]